MITREKRYLSFSEDEISDLCFALACVAQADEDKVSPDLPTIRRDALLAQVERLRALARKITEP